MVFFHTLTKCFCTICISKCCCVETNKRNKDAFIYHNPVQKYISIKTPWAWHNLQNADSVQDSNELNLCRLCLCISSSGSSQNMSALMALPVSSLPRSSVWVLGLGSVHSPHLATNTDYHQLIRRQTHYQCTLKSSLLIPLQSEVSDYI